MALELVYTSATRGLREGTSGFCTVAMTRGLPMTMVPRLEALGGYRPGPSGNGPVALSFWRLETGQGVVNVLTRVGPAAPDHTQRTNKLATYLVLSSDEQCEAGPAWLLANVDMRDAWEGAARWLEDPVRIPRDATRALAPCGAWERACGDAGWAGVLASAFLRDMSKPAHIIYREGTDALALVQEAALLLPAWARWRATFSTYFVQPVAGATCSWRFCLEGTPAADLARNSKGLVIDITRPLGLAPESRHVRAARTGVLEPGEPGSAEAAGAAVTAGTFAGANASPSSAPSWAMQHGASEAGGSDEIGLQPQNDPDGEGRTWASAFAARSQRERAKGAGAGADSGHGGAYASRRPRVTPLVLGTLAAGATVVAVVVLVLLIPRGGDTGSGGGANTGGGAAGAGTSASTGTDASPSAHPHPSNGRKSSPKAGSGNSAVSPPVRVDPSAAEHAAPIPPDSPPAGALPWEEQPTDASKTGTPPANAIPSGVAPSNSDPRGTTYKGTSSGPEAAPAVGGGATSSPAPAAIDAPWTTLSFADSEVEIVAVGALPPGTQVSRVRFAPPASLLNAGIQVVDGGMRLPGSAGFARVEIVDDALRVAVPVQGSSLEVLSSVIKLPASAAPAEFAKTLMRRVPVELLDANNAVVARARVEPPATKIFVRNQKLRVSLNVVEPFLRFETFLESRTGRTPLGTAEATPGTTVRVGGRAGQITVAFDSPTMLNITPEPLVDPTAAERTRRMEDLRKWNERLVAARTVEKRVRGISISDQQVAQALAVIAPALNDDERALQKDAQGNTRNLQEIEVLRAVLPVFIVRCNEEIKKTQEASRALGTPGAKIDTVVAIDIVSQDGLCLYTLYPEGTPR
jgi:hypothetical protein